MKRRLIVMRHAKSSWKQSGQPDRARPLNERGRRDAPRVGRALAERGWVPERVLVSTAARTRETWDLMAGAFEPAPEVSFLEALYLAGPREVEDALEALPDDVSAALVLGHNNGWEDVVEWLSGEEVGLGTACAALLVGEGDTWAEALALAPTWRLKKVVRPKEL